MARPRLDDEERRARTVGVRVTAAEAQSCGSERRRRGSRWGPTCAAGRWVSGCGSRQSCGWGKGGSTNLHRAYASPAYGSQS